MTSVNWPWSGQPVRTGIRMRCPEDEMGRNSVIPCTTASTMICSIVMIPPAPSMAACSARGRFYTEAQFRAILFAALRPPNGSMATLLHYPLCPFSRSIRLALAERGVEVDAHRGAALGMAAGLSRAEPSRLPAGADHRRGRADLRRLRHLRISRRDRERRRRGPRLQALPRRRARPRRGAAAGRLVPPQVPRRGDRLSR